jgi:hypothetical protein
MPTAPSPGTSAANAAAALSFQAAGNVTALGGESGSAPILTIRVRVPCQIRCTLMTITVCRSIRAAKHILWVFHLSTTKSCG